MECFWSGGARPNHRVLPDGCTDIVFYFQDGRARAYAVGAMTQARIVDASAIEFLGVRFHPGMSHGLLGVPVSELTDQIVELESLWGKDARRVEEQVVNAATEAERIALLTTALPTTPEVTPVQKAVEWVAAVRGDASVDELARHVGLSARQFRRVCIEQTGLAPKMLCRIVRFRNTVGQLVERASVGHADIALDCGYYDQAHFINEFHEFSGLAPRQYLMSVSSNPESGDPV